jgi:hypothetical protein
MIKSALRGKYAELFSAVDDDDIPISYTPKFREFFIDVRDGGSSGILIGFCPWTGVKLPSSMRDHWFDVLEEMGVDPHEDSIPQEMLSEEWWLRETYDSTLL